MVRKTLAAAVALCAFAVAPAFVLAQDTTQQTQIITVMPSPYNDYGMTIYNAVPVTDQPAFITWLNGFQPDQRVTVVRTLHLYSMQPNLTPFTTDTTADVAMPVFVNVLTPEDQPTFRTFWTGMTPEQQTAFITYARDIYPQQNNNTTNVGTTQGVDIFTSMPSPESGYGTTLYSSIPSSDQANFINWLNGYTPDQRVMIVRTLHTYSTTPNMTAFTTDTTPSTAMPVFVNVLTPADQPTFTTMWNSMTPEQQNDFIMYARDVYPTTTTTTDTTTTGMPPSDTETQSTTTTSTTTMTGGSAAQPFGVTMAAAFVGFLPEAEHDTYMRIASDTPISELGGMNNFLSSLTPEQAAMCVHAIGALNAMGKSGARPHEGMSDYNVRKLLMAQVPDADRTNFDAMMSGMTDQQKSTLEQLARDAFNGGMNDIGASATTGTSTTTAP